MFGKYCSVIIPLYNKEKSIVHTIQSVLKQTYTNYEIIIVDDGSTDKSASIVDRIVKEFKDQVRIIRKKNGGVSSARNIGIKEAKYDYIALLDGDDLWDKHYLEEQMKMIQ